MFLTFVVIIFNCAIMNLVIKNTLLAFVFCTSLNAQELNNYENGHEYVDLGLSVKWATCNVGALKPHEDGYHYAWGSTDINHYNYDPYHRFRSDDTIRYGLFCWTAYEFCTYADITLSKYCTKKSYAINSSSIDNKVTLEPEDDVAHVKWGGKWRMPTKKEFKELIKNCTWVLTTQNGVKGFLITSNKKGFQDRSIFMPASGIQDGYYNTRNHYSKYWSSSLDNTLSNRAITLTFDSYDKVDISTEERCNGCTIRPVCQ